MKRKQSKRKQSALGLISDEILHGDRRLLSYEGRADSFQHLITVLLDLFDGDFEIDRVVVRDDRGGDGGFPLRLLARRQPPGFKREE